MLAYVLPLIPFIYFTFAVLGWVLELFEAIAAMPLWALAHLRIEGDRYAWGSGHRRLPAFADDPYPPSLDRCWSDRWVGDLWGSDVLSVDAYLTRRISISRDELTGGDNWTRWIGRVHGDLCVPCLQYRLDVLSNLVDDVPKGMLRWLGRRYHTVQ